jgi:hypothetical protein
MDKVFFNAQIWNTYMSHNCFKISDSITAGLSYVRKKLTERSCLISLTKISPDIQKLRSKWGHVRGTAEVRPYLCRKLSLLIARTMRNTHLHYAEKDTAFSAKPGGTEAVASTRLERVTRHFRAKEMRKHQAKSMHLTALWKVYCAIKLFDAGKHPIIRLNNYRLRRRELCAGSTIHTRYWFRHRNIKRA